MEVAADPAAVRLGAKVRDLRHSRGLTLVQLAEATDLSHPFLSQCERGLASFSLASLRRIAVALGTSPVELVAAAEHGGAERRGPAVEVRRSGQGGGAVADFADGGARALAMGARPFLPLEFCGDNAEPGDLFVHAEDEFIYVLEGEVCIEVGGTVEALLRGDCAYYAGGEPHRWWGPSGPYRLLVVKESSKALWAQPDA